MKRTPEPPAPKPVKANESICPSCELPYHEPPGTPIMCVKCGDWMVTDSVPE